MAWTGPMYSCRARDYLLGNLESLQPRFAFTSHCEDVEAWRAGLRAQLRRVLGIESLESCPLDVKVLAERDYGQYARVKIAFNVLEGLTALGYVLVPAAAEGRLPAVVCLPDLGLSKEHLAGLTGDPRRDPDMACALALCRQGMVAVALDLSGEGERADHIADLADACGAYGLPLLGLWVWETLRAVEYVAGRMEVRPERVGITGLGRGAEVALLAAALDERVHCTATSGFMGSYAAQMLADNCLNTRPWLPDGLLQTAHIADIACLVAPRNLRMQFGEDDLSFPLTSVLDCADAVRAGFERMGEQFRLEAEIVPGGHVYHGEGNYEFLNTWLKLP